MTDNKQICICPACGKEMTKIKAPDNNFCIDICEECGGIYFDNRELEKFDEKHENIDFITDFLKGKTFKQVSQEQKRICPACGAVMVKNFASTKKEIEIDCCYACGGKFLDFGELDKIREQYNSEKDRSEDFMKDFMKSYSPHIQQAEMEAKRLESERSCFRKLFLKYWGK